MVKKLTPEEIKQLTHGIPRTRYPWSLETYYSRRIRTLVSGWKAIADDHIQRLINPKVKGGSQILTDDDHSDDIAAAIAVMLIAINGADSDAFMASMVSSYLHSVDTFSYKNIQAQASHVNLTTIEHNSTLDEYTKMKIKENVALIKSMRSDFTDRLEKTIYQSINDGGGVGAIAKALTKTTQMANNHAAFIANDQTGKILGQLDAYRSQRAGASKYIWQSMEDARVRPRHQELDGTVQSYNDPNGGDDGQLPGEPYRCRCVALSIFDL
ncbi:phage Mu protein F like protein [Lentilactobacillus sunkii]|uniref:Phage Mu protein F like protein n=1 Tax=Lentilactobacillus sunkii TaxID=481719 RepID=A0A1E7XCK8_9LACO|nr:phage minor head protein [Lentilactobacillus sunkii]OFA10761.1 phage Mu protein F like protein [Lentilactobacillus sunkii]